MPNVTILIENDLPSPTPVEDVAIEFYTTGGVFQTSGTTDEDGEVTVSLPVDFYDVVLYKPGVTFLPRQPQRIEVLASPASNNFSISCHERVAPESIDALRCTVSGYILGVDGKQARHRIVFEPVKNLLVLNNNVVAPYHRVEITSSEDGYFEFELLRNREYNAYFVNPYGLFGVEPGKLAVVTPNQPAAPLDKLLFPVPLNMDFSAPTISLLAGGEQDESITASLSYSDGSIRTATGNQWAYVKIENTDNTIVEAFLSGGILCLKPLSPGTATITTSRVMSDLVTIDPLEDYASESVVVTVS